MPAHAEPDACPPREMLSALDPCPTVTGSFFGGTGGVGAIALPHSGPGPTFGTTEVALAGHLAGPGELAIQLPASVADS